MRAPWLCRAPKWPKFACAWTAFFVAICEATLIITRTPLRMSFVGGGSDLPTFNRKHGGAVLSTAVDKYVYVNVNKKFDAGIRVAYSRTEEVERVDEIKHRLVKATF